MRSVCSVARRFRRVEFYRLSGMTRQLVVPSGDMPITWSTVPYPQGANWLNSNDTEPIEPSEENMGDIQYRRCDCALKVDWCICKKT